MTALNYLPKVREQYENYPYPFRDPEEDRTRLIAPSTCQLDKSIISASAAKKTSPKISA